MDRYADYCAGLRSPMQHLRHRARWSKFLGDQLADDIKPGDIRVFMRKQVTTLAPATVNLELAYLSKVFSLAMDDELILEMLRELAPSRVLFTPDQDAHSQPEVAHRVHV
ncbi:hypothetical protein IV102_25755 [bacterium]|nr:hypothetical protein [bacterium]